MPFPRKRTRLPADQYRGRRWYFVTVCCDRRRTPFSNAARAEWLIARLREMAAAHAFLVHAWCVMPDHLHLLVEGADLASNLLDFLARFKQNTAFEARRRFRSEERRVGKECRL